MKYTRPQVTPVIDDRKTRVGMGLPTELSTVFPQRVR